MPSSEFSQRTSDMHKACDDLGAAIKGGDLGDIVAKHEKLIHQYYLDVLAQVDGSFRAAQAAAKIGFVVLILTWVYVLVFEGLARFEIPTSASLTIVTMGTVGGALIEFIAGIAFVLYARAARQFGAFHICLERTHRYLLAYKIADEIKDNKDTTLRDLACIIANASMISHEHIENSGSRPNIPKVPLAPTP